MRQQNAALPPSPGRARRHCYLGHVLLPVLLVCVVFGLVRYQQLASTSPPAPRPSGPPPSEPPSADLPDTLPPLTRIASWSHAPPPPPESPPPPLTFVREYFESPHRGDEVADALRETMHSNPSANYVIVVDDRSYLSALRLLQGEEGVAMAVYWAPAGVTYDRLLRACRAAAPGHFVLSTADVAIPSLAPLRQACGAFFDRRDVLFTISRRDLGDGGGRDAASYAGVGSWDVFIGSADLVTDQVLANTVFSPRYFGVENVVAHELLRGRTPYNLFQYIDVVHHHRRRLDDDGRLRINHPDNSQGSSSTALAEVCDVAKLRAHLDLPAAA